MTNAEHHKIYSEKAKEINEMSEEELCRRLISGVCPNPIEHLVGFPIGMFHCELCGTMVIPGCHHGPIDPPFRPDQNAIASSYYEDFPELFENENNNG